MKQRPMAACANATWTISQLASLLRPRSWAHSFIRANGRNRSSSANTLQTVVDCVVPTSTRDKGGSRTKTRCLCSDASMPPAIVNRLRKYLRPEGDKNVVRIRRRRRLLGVFWTNLPLLMYVLGCSCTSICLTSKVVSRCLP